MRNNKWWLLWLGVSLTVFLPGILGQEEEPLLTYTFQGLQKCTLTTVELIALNETDQLEPCIIYDETTENINTTTTTATITMVQVTPANCGNQRDGAVTAIQSLNNDNDGKGISIGFNEDYYVNFRLVSVIAGNAFNLTEEEYEIRHEMILNSMLESLEAPYIVGSCSFKSVMDKTPALQNQAILMSQVGPPGFYKDENPYVFGFHINSDTYPIPNVRALQFWGKKQEGGVEGIPVFVVSRKESEFFRSTCQSAIDNLKDADFKNITELFFDHNEDHDDDGVLNESDEDFLISLADQVCPPGSGEMQDFHPALFVCTLKEQDTLLNRWLENGCSPISLWLTAATWGWASKNLEKIPYFLGGGQWHKAFKYKDKYFSSGQDLLDYNSNIFGYNGTYDQVVSYAIPVLFAQHLVSHYRVVDNPDPVADFKDVNEREMLRRDMLVLTAETIFGPVSFNEDKRNIGRESAGSQWLLDLTGSDQYQNTLVSPLLQAQAQIVVPGINTESCEGGYFLNETLQVEQGALLLGSCSACPVDSYTPPDSRLRECNKCPDGSSTLDLEAVEVCTIREDNLLPTGMLAFGYIAVAITWILSLGFTTWLIIYKTDAVVKVGQFEFLIMICIGTIISSSTVIALGQQAGSDEDTSTASLGCTLAPFLYAIGWVIQYSSLTAKTYRLYKVMQYKHRARRKTIKFLKMFRIVVAALLFDLILLIVWTSLSPLEYQRIEQSKSIDKESGLIIIDSVGRCVPSNPDISPWAFAGPLLGFHLILMLTTNVLLYQVKDVTDRYQEQKYVGMASIFMFEILVVGVPVFIAVNDSPLATFVVLLSFIVFNDIGLLCFIFIPKVIFQRKGLEEGVNVGESILKDTYRRATTRENFHRTYTSNVGSSVSNYNKSDDEDSVILSIVDIKEETSNDIEKESTSEEIRDPR